MSVRQQAAQLLMTGIDAAGPTSGQRRTLIRHRPGFVLLLGRSAGVAATAAMTAKLAAQMTPDSGIGPMVTADQEGGKIQRLSGSGFDEIPSQRIQGAWPAARLRTQASGWGRQLARAGVLLNLAPVADVVPRGDMASNAPIGALHREFGSTAAAVSASVRAAIAGWRTGGVATSLKHFPGLGRVTGNTDFTGGVTDDRTTASDLATFRAGVVAGTDTVLISTARYTRIDPANLAVFSRTVITDLLRGRLGFTGVVVSDDLGVAAQVKGIDFGQRAVRFVRAGGDVVITAEVAATGPMIDALVAEANRSTTFATTLRTAVTRVLVLKTRYGLAHCGMAR